MQQFHSPQNRHPLGPATDPEHQTATDLTEITLHVVPAGDGLLHVVLGDLVLAADPLNGVVFDDEVGGEHGGGDFAVVGAVAYELGALEGKTGSNQGERGGKMEKGKGEGERYAIDEVVAFDGITELDGAAEAGGGDVGHVWAVCFGLCLDGRFVLVGDWIEEKCDDGCMAFILCTISI